jgi:hypothetical protein
MNDVALTSKPPLPEKSKLRISNSSRWSDDDGTDDGTDYNGTFPDDDELTGVEALEWNNYLNSIPGLCECFRISTSPNNNDVPDSIIIDYINNKLNDGSLSIAVN